MAEFLLECYSEEMPAGAQRPAADALKSGLEEGFRACGVSAKAFFSYVTPKRLIVIGEGVGASTPDMTEEKRGPRVGAPDAAVSGFAQSCGVGISALEARETLKGAFYFYETRRPSRPTAEIVSGVVEAALKKLPWPKAMCWGSYDIAWIRPLKSLLCVFDGNVVPVRFGPITASNVVYAGLPTAEKSASVASFADYAAWLEGQGVMWNDKERIAYVETKAREEAAALGGKLREDSALAEENAGLAESPVILSGAFDDECMEAPAEVLTTSMRSNQKYFCVEDENGNLLPRFVFVANGVSPEKAKNVVKGNERVLRARLQDALYFRRRDLSRPLESRTQELERLVFHAELGSVADKVRRLRSLAKLVAVWVPGANLMHVDRAAALCKCDLTTQTVIEFTELQGVVGRNYALTEGEASETAQAIGEHYLPEGANSPCPRSPAGVALALADKIDSLCGLFAAGERATGSKDPYGLRRYAMGVIRLVTENNLRVPMKLLIENAMDRYPSALFKDKNKNIIQRVIPVGDGARERKNGLVDDIFTFILDRLRVLLKDQGVRHDYIDAALSAGVEPEQDLVRILLKLKALKAFADTEEAAAALQAYRRAAGVADKTERTNNAAPLALNEEAPAAEEERALYKELSDMRRYIEKKIAEDAFGDVLKRYAEAAPTVQRFFDAVVVNGDDETVRRNRLALVAGFRDAARDAADFSRLQYERAAAYARPLA
ncbi:MAG: glycine--tRNA ligase subunit beta [Rickettsiales bacterium]